MADKNDQKDHGSTDDQKKPKTKRGRRFWIIGGLVVLFVSAGLIYLGYWVFIARFNVGTDDAYVHGNQVAITPQISGIVASVEADDTQLVQRGQVLVRLDQNDAQVALAQAKAQLGQAVRQVRQLYQQEIEQKAAIAQRTHDLDLATQDYNRYKDLVNRNTIAVQQFEHSKTTWETAKDALRQATDTLKGLETQTDFADLRHQPNVALAISNLRRAYIDLERTTVVAPVTGYVAQRTVQVGQQVAPGTALLAIIPEDQMWVEANFKETQLGSVRIGQPATVRSDFYKGAVQYPGRVVGILSGTGDVFQLLPPQNATGNWIKIVRRVPVRIALDQEQMRRHPLRLGLSVEASVDIHHVDGPALAETSSQKPLYQTDVYADQGGKVDALIDETIRENGGDQSPTATPDSLSQVPDHGEQQH
ncbi:MAG: HlyD family efflux transporter periplasmic adaptor subunit [Verrucomicrobia bacterium]|nr:HlyD family efflux transporter periplasmic adaptor subunit [Verrucomicrobiota bacterium]